MESDSAQELWQVEAGGEVFNACFDEMTAWIDEGSLLRIDRVRKGNLRWIEAGKVPALIEFFNAKDSRAPQPPVVTTTNFERLGPERAAEAPAAVLGAQLPDALEAAACIMHPDARASYICDTCGNSFCKACPNSYGGTVRICPMCGAMCKSLEQAKKIQTETVRRAALANGRLEMADVAKAFAHPFNFKVSLAMGAVMYAIFSLGQSAAGMGSIFLIAAAIMSFMLANMLSFGVLAHTSESFAAGRLDANFMPSFDDFSIWDDVVQPFFLSLGAYISSFGPLILLVVVAFFFLLNAAKPEMNPVQADAARAVDPKLPYAANAMKQSQAVRDLLEKQRAAANERIENTERQARAAESGDVPDAPPAANVQPYDEEAEFARLNNMIQESRKAQLESAFGKTPETVKADQAQTISQILSYGLGFLLIGAVFALWGIFYFPAACAVAGYTQSVGATLNPLVGLDTIKRLGTDYVKVLAVFILIGVISAIVGGVLGSVRSAFELPGFGNLPAKFLGSIVGFYLWAVFSCVIGMALYKASDRLKLPS